MARENRGWGYDRIVGALANLGHQVSDQTVGNIPRRRDIAPAPKRSRTTTWKEFIQTHMDVLAGADFFTVKVLTWRGLVTYYVLFFIAYTSDESGADQVYVKADKGLAYLGVQVLRTPPRAPKANSVCERLGGSLRRECLDFLIPLNERHLQMTIRDWAIRYHRGTRHSALGPGLPEPKSDQVPSNEHRHSLPIEYRFVKRSLLGGLHHEYGVVKEAA